MGLAKVRSLNRHLVFDHIARADSISRSDLARGLELSPTAVATITSELVELGLVRESGVGESTGGRRPALLQARSSTTCLLALELQVAQVQAIVCDPGGRVLARDTRPSNAAAGPPAVVEALEAAGRAAVASAASNDADGASERRLWGVGVAWSGLVKPDGSVTSPDVPGWGARTVPLREAMEDAFGAPCIVDNDANLGAFAELRHGAGRKRQHLVYVLVHNGVGAGVVTEGRLYRGHNHAAGEIGHTAIDQSGERCHCGNYGCLETMVSAEALVREAIARVRLGIPSQLSNRIGEGVLQVDDVIDAALAGDSAAVGAVEHLGTRLGVAFANVVSVYSPEIVVLGGPLIRLGNLLLEPAEAVARERILRPLRDQVTFTLSDLGADGPMLGATSAALDARLESLDSSTYGDAPDADFSSVASRKPGWSVD